MRKSPEKRLTFDSQGSDLSATFTIVMRAYKGISELFGVNMRLISRLNMKGGRLCMTY